MDHADPKPTTDVDLLLRALHRADQYWPDRRDLEQYWEEQQYFLPFESIVGAETAIRELHRREITEDAIAPVVWGVREKAIGLFLDAHANTEDRFKRSSAEEIIKQLMLSGRFNSLEGFLRNIMKSGAEEALKKHLDVDRGSRYGHFFAGFLGIVEILVLLFLLNACQHGFQTMVICAFGLMYSVVAFQNIASNDSTIRRFGTVVSETSRIRYLLRDRAYKRDETEADFLQLEKSLARNRVRYWISCGKFGVIDLICLGGLIINSR